MENQWPVLIIRGDDAQEAGDFKKAADLYQRALSQDPLSAPRVYGRLVRTYLAWTEEDLRNHGPEAALKRLEAARAIKPLPADAQQQILRKWQALYCRLMADKIADMAARQNWRRIGLLPFVQMSGDAGADLGEAFAQQISQTLSGRGLETVAVRSLPDGSAKMLVSALYDDIPDADKRRIQGWGDDVVITGRIGADITTCACKLDQAQTQTIAYTQNPGLAQTVKPIWPDNNALQTGQDGVVITIRTDKTEYAVGEGIRFQLRANRQCYVTLVDIQTSGKVSLIYPMLEGSRNLCLVGKQYSVPAAHEAPFRVKGPAGQETVKVIASMKPLMLDRVVNGEVPEEIFVVMLSEQLKKLQSDRAWDIGQCSFTVK